VAMGMLNRTDGGSCVGGASRGLAPSGAGTIADSRKHRKRESIVSSYEPSEPNVASEQGGAGRPGTPGNGTSEGDAGRTLRDGGHSPWPETLGARAIAKASGR
jgi:hypothetical protein